METKNKNHTIFFTAVLSFIPVFYVVRILWLNSLFDFSDTGDMVYRRILYATGLCAPIALIKIFSKKMNLQGGGKSAKKIPKSVLFLSAALVLLLSFFEESETNISEKPSYITLFFVFYVIIPPILEEYLFRRLVFGNLAYSGYLSAAIFSSFFFALSHFSFARLPICFLSGMIFAYLTYRANSIKYAVLIHFLNNFCAFLFLFIENKRVKYISMIILAIFIAVLSGILLIIKRTGQKSDG